MKKITIQLVCATYALLFLMAKCNKSDNDIAPPFYIKANVNGTAWQANTISTTTVNGPFGIDPATITGFFNTEEIGFVIFNSSPGNYTFKPGRMAPVTLLNFSGEIFESGHRLIWNTATETNLSQFSIEAGTDGLNWITVTSVTATGSNSSYQSVINTDIVPGINRYYRLKMINTDASFAYSNVVVIGGNYYAYYKANGNVARRGYNGNLEISTIDRAARIVTGRFNFKVKTSSGQLYDITNGEFRVNY